jgi:hypothetical protein
MHSKPFSAFVAAIAAAAVLASAAFASSGPSVTVTVKTASRTLLRPTGAHGERGSITKGGTPSGKCPGSSAAGALDVATRGKWTGKYYASVGGIFITSILGVKPTGKQYWGVYVGGHLSSQGVCSIKLKTGEHLLFKITK